MRPRLQHGPALSRLFSTTPSTMLQQYRRRVQSGALTADVAQEAVATRLQRLSDRLQHHQLVLDERDRQLQAQQAQQAANAQAETKTQALAPLQVPRGMYLHGPVGCGKSLLMDLFYDTAPITRKRRVHFHQFMDSVHTRVAEYKQYLLHTYGRNRHVDTSPERDALTQVATAIARESWLLCFDEFQVTDIVDAVIMAKLFSTMFSQGVVMVATSNRAPQELYENGINRLMFLPCIDLLTRHCKVHNMGSTTDYRLRGHRLAAKWFAPFELTAMRKQFQDMAGSAVPAPVSVPTTHGRLVDIPAAAANVAWVEFDEICGKAHGAADFRAICQHYRTVFVAGVPQLSTAKHNEAKRFITLVDEAYEHRTQLIVCAATEPQLLFSDITPELDPNEAGILASTALYAGVADLRFSAARAISRLTEMMSDAYQQH